MRYHCCDTLRRNAVAAHPTLNGIDYLDVLDRELPDAHPMRQRTLFLHFLKPVTAAGLSADNLRILGGERILDPRVEWAQAGQPAPAALDAEEAAVLAALADADRVLVIRSDSSGDHSQYRLQLVRAPNDDRVPDNFDPQLAELAFSFKVECPSDFDCRAQHDCPEDAPPVPDINYLAKDYGSFRRLLLDRLRRLVPEWAGRSAADSGVMLAELLAYVGDQLSYQQDAVATEGYLGTARRRISLRRHAALVDYAMHDGCNARTWLQLQVDAAAMTLPQADTRFLTHCVDVDTVVAPGSLALTRALRQKPVVFEPLHDAALYAAHNRMPLYTWGDRRCCLPAGATHATLRGHYPDLLPGMAVLFEELLGPQTGSAGDADPGHRHVVRLTIVRHSDDNGDPRVDPLNGETVTEIFWASEDALPFPLCVSAVTDEDRGAELVENVSVARGNLVLADHGHTLDAENLGEVPRPHLFSATRGDGRCDTPPPRPLPPRYHPRLQRGPLTQAGGVWTRIGDAGATRRVRLAFDPDAPAAQALRWDMADVWPQIVLTDSDGDDWRARRSLLDSAATALEFVAEVGDDGLARLRFGDDRLGRRPESGTGFTARYRVGNGAAGNVGSDALVHIVTATTGILGVRNPLPARGGIEPESAESVRRRAPEAFRRQERAVTPEDYAEVTERQSGIQNAAATLRWTGAWHTVFVTVDRAGGQALTPAFDDALEQHVDRYRMAGHDLHFNDPIHVPLELALHVCVKRDWFRADVRRGLLDRLGNRVLRDGTRGLFHPDEFSFGDPVYLSRIYAAAHAVPGVDSVQVTAFRRQHSDDVLALEEGRIALGRLEIARLDNDPSFPERGVLKLEMHGGK